MPIEVVINMFLAMVRNFVPTPTYEKIKGVVDAAMALPKAGDGERTAYVITEALKIAQTTRTPLDDFAVSLAAFLYLKKKQAKK